MFVAQDSGHSVRQNCIFCTPNGLKRHEKDLFSPDWSGNVAIGQIPCKKGTRLDYHM